MKAVKRIWAIVILCTCLSQTNSQIPLRIFKFSSVPSSIALGDTFSFYAFVRTDSTVTYTGLLSFYYTINDTLHTFPNDTSGIAYDTLPNTTIAPFDTVNQYMRINVSFPAFNVGPSVVVIWPKTFGGLPTYAKDSLKLFFTVVPSAISNVEHERLRLYISGNSLRVEKDAEIQLRRVRIFDVLGRLIHNQLSPADNIPLPYTNRGIYLAEIIYNDNQRKTFRFYY